MKKIALFLVLALAGCAPQTPPAPVYGTIVDKMYVPAAHTTSYIVGGKSGIKPIFSSTPEQWLVLADIQGKTESLHVEKDQYARAEKGQRWQVQSSWGSFHLVQPAPEK